MFGYFDYRIIAPYQLFVTPNGVHRIAISYVRRVVIAGYHKLSGFCKPCAKLKWPAKGMSSAMAHCRRLNPDAKRLKVYTSRCQMAQFAYKVH